MKEGTVKWNPEDGIARTVVSITERCEKGEEPEPGLCANFQNGDYAALYNCELEEFIIAYPILSALKAEDPTVR